MSNVSIKRDEGPRIIVFVLVTLFSACSYALDELKTEALNQALGDIQEEQNIPALAVAIVDDGDLIYANGFGRLDDEEKQSVTEDTLFRVASITKLFTAQAAMQLIEEKKLSLNGKVHHFLPEFKGSDIAISNLLTHTSGLVDSEKPIDSKRPFAEYIAETLNNADLESSHGFIYADVNYNVLGRIIEELDDSGLPYVFIYVSDHGESLLEDGHVFHGMPPGVPLPPEQAHVPLIVKSSIPISIVERQEYGQQDVYDTVLGLFSIETDIGRKDRSFINK